MSKYGFLHMRKAVAFGAAITALTAICGTAAPVSATPLSAGAAAAADGIRTSDQQRVDAAAVVHLDPTPDVLLLSDQAFVHALWRKAKDAGENLDAVRTAAEQAMASTLSDDHVKFITVGIHEAYKLDMQREKERADAERAARLAKSQALIVVGIPSTPEFLGLSDDNFIRAVAENSASGPEVRAAAARALLGSPAAWREFITNGVREAHQRDVANKLKELEEKDRKEAERRKEIAARTNVAALFHVAPTDAMLGLSDDNFIRELLRSAPGSAQNSELYSAADRALLSSNPADWKTFILTGAEAAYRRDDEARRKRIAENNRKLVMRIQAAAENSGVNPGLADAAKKALTGSDEDVVQFLKEDSQYRARRQTFGSAFMPTYLVRQSDADGERVFTGPVDFSSKMPDREAATWVIVPALGGQAGCYSFESVRRPGYYLTLTDTRRVQLAMEDGTSESQRRASWCVRKSLNGAKGVSFESAYSSGSWLRSWRGELWVGTNVSNFPENYESTWWIDVPLVD
ncbi:AbfB domain-containing protein [Streptomyces ehimensis]|uniref:AbfB domain-containing protein n=1 Tax=Streptomyces ehimensis TaxID=68195 RepID=A0ABV9BUF5_9ACTN